MKTTRTWIGSGAALALALGACGGGEPEAAEEAPAAEPMNQAIANSMRGGLADALLYKDANRATAYYAEDAVAYTVDGNTATGMAAIQQNLSALIAAGYDSIGMTSQSFEATGDQATDRGTAVIRKLDPQTREATRYNANYELVFARQADGTFKIVKDSVGGVTELPPAP
jgi:ketosteroid isomerase-like protein